MTSAEQLIAALERAPAIVIPLVCQANPSILKRLFSIHNVPAPGAPRFLSRVPDRGAPSSQRLARTFFASRERLRFAA